MSFSMELISVQVAQIQLVSSSIMAEDEELEDLCTRTTGELLSVLPLAEDNVLGTSTFDLEYFLATVVMEDSLRSLPSGTARRLTPGGGGPAESQLFLRACCPSPAVFSLLSPLLSCFLLLPPPEKKFITLSLTVRCMSFSLFASTFGPAAAAEVWRKNPCGEVQGSLLV